VTRSPLAVTLIAVLMVAVSATSGAFLSLLRPPTERFARARIAARPVAHGLTGAAEYDAEVADRAVFAAEAGVSFLHTHAGGLGPLALVASTLVASLVPWRRARAALQALLGVGGLFPLGYLVYSLAVLEAGRETGVELTERYVLAPLGSAVIAGLLGLAAALVLGRRRAPGP
jgi:hypothetical protein